MAKKSKKSKKTKKKVSAKAGKKPAAKKKAAPKKAPVAASGGQTVNLICSECEEPLHFNSATADDTLTCPECLCSAKKPDAEFVNTVSMHARSEKVSLILAILTLILFLASTLAFILVSSPMNDGGEENTRMICLGASGLFLILSMVFLFKYEKSRWQVYF